MELGGLRCDFCSAAGIQRDVPEVQQLEESEGRQLLRPQSHAVPGVVPKHPPARLAARGRRHHGKCSRRACWVMVPIKNEEFLSSSVCEWVNGTAQRLLRR